MTESINSQTPPPQKYTDDLMIKSARFGAYGWVAFIITFIFFMTYVLIDKLTPQPVAAVENGKIVGTVIYGSANSRPRDIIMSDAKDWIETCLSLDKHNIFENMGLCLNHRTLEDAERMYDEYQSINYLGQIQENGCSRVEFFFDDKKQQYYHDRDQSRIDLIVGGTMLCFISGQKEPTQRDFSNSLTAVLLPKTKTAPFGFEVLEFNDIAIQDDNE